MLNKARLDVTLSIMDVREIDQKEDSFKCKIRIFAFWRIDLHDYGEHLIDHYYITN